MKKVYKVLVPSLIMTMLLSSVVYADNPIVQTNYTADPAPMVYNDTCYLYTSHDEDTIVNNFFTMNDWKCYSSKDMVNWTDQGTPLAYTDFTWAKGDAWAGQCIPRNGKFYYYVPMTAKSGGTSIGVAVSDSPTGPFKDAIGKPLIAPGYGNIDPTVFIDDDGQAYLYWGNPSLKYVKLNKDMISYSGSIVTVPLTTAGFGTRSNTDRETSYEEGPWFYKRGSLYYMIFAGGPISEHIAYSTSTSPTGPWTYRGKIMPAQGGSFTNHPGVADFKGNSYFFYHNGALPNGGGYHRSVGIEKFSYNADGTIPTINMTTTGVPATSNLNPYIKTEAETICWESGVETEKCSEGGMDVGYIENGDYIKVKGVNFGTEATSFEARVASATSGGNIELRLDSPTGKLIGTLAVKGTGGWQTWTTNTCTVSGATGVHDLYLKFTGGSGSLFNFNWWKFVTVTTPTVNPTVAPTVNPTIAPTVNPTMAPTLVPTTVPTTSPSIGAKPVVTVSTTNNGNSIGQTYTIKANGGTIDLTKISIAYTADGMSTVAQTVFIDNAALQLNVAPYYTSINSAVTGTINNGKLAIAINSNTQLSEESGYLTINLRFAKTDWSTYDTLSNEVVKVYYNGVLVQ